MQNTQGNRSILFPLILIVGGGIWLLRQANIISTANIAMLFRLIPLILIIVGVELVIRGRYPQIATYLGIGSVIVIIGLVLVGPALGWVGTREVQTGSYEEPLNDATSAEISVGISIGEVIVNALEESSNLFEADITYIGRVEFFQRGDAQRFVSLQQTDSGSSRSFDFGDVFNLWDIDAEEINWHVWIAQSVPVNLDVNAGVGRSTLNLEALTLTRLNVNAGVGEITATLPSSEASYNATFNGGTGSMHITITEGAALELRVSGGVGDTVIDVPSGAALSLDASTGLGAVNVPSDYQRVSGDDDDGVWESSNFDESQRQIVIHYDGGVGGLTIR
jgi:hypothetical protein